MIRYFNFESINIGPIFIHVWGLFVATGIIAGVLLACWLARRQKLSPEVMLDIALWMLAGALIMARFFHVAVYEPAYYWAHPENIIKFWQGGASSTGGFLGAFVGLFVIAKVRHFRWRDLMSYLDILALSLWLGWGIGRIGCFLTHQHPGRLTNFFLAVNYPAGARLDLGLLESLTGFGLFFVFLALFQRLTKIRRGLVMVYSFASYAAIRFFLDFLRATPQDYLGGDVRYFILTPAQWAMLILAVMLIVVWIDIKQIHKLDVRG